MSITPNYVPREYKTLNVFLMVKHADKAIEFYNSAFGADVEMVLRDPNGVIVHAEIKIADTVIFLSENISEESKANNVVLQLYVGDVEGVFEDALNAGATEVTPIKNQFYGDRSGRLRDPFGHEWILSTRVENFTAKEIQDRFHQLFN